MACGWSPVGSNGATRRKSGTGRSYHTERAFEPIRSGPHAAHADPKEWGSRDKWAMTSGWTRRPRFGRRRRGLPIRGVTPTPARRGGLRSERQSMELEYKDDRRKGRFVILAGVVLALVAGGIAFYAINQAQQQASQSGAKKVPAVVAVVAIPARQEITPGDVAVREVPLDDTNANGRDLGPDPGRRADRRRHDPPGPAGHDQHARLLHARAAHSPSSDPTRPSAPIPRPGGRSPSRCPTTWPWAACSPSARRWTCSSPPSST